MTGCTVMEPPEPENTDPDTMHVDPPDTVTPGPVYAESTRRLMTEFAIAKTDNPQIDYNIRFTYDSVSRTYKSSTQRWIEGIDSLKPSFVADGEVYLNEMEIQSGTTPCDFRYRIVVFTIKNTEELIQQTCTVSIISPQTTGLPVFKIDIEGGKSVLDKETYLPSAYLIYTHDSKLTGNLGIRGRADNRPLCRSG